MFAAFELGEFHRVFGGGSKILLPEARLLPLTMGGFIVSLAEAAKTCIPRRVCCLWSWSVSSGLWRRQQKPAS